MTDRLDRIATAQTILRRSILPNRVVSQLAAEIVNALDGEAEVDALFRICAEADAEAFQCHGQGSEGRIGTTLIRATLNGRAIPGDHHVGAQGHYRSGRAYPEPLNDD